jgi:hypothetical protein
VLLSAEPIIFADKSRDLAPDLWGGRVKGQNYFIKYKKAFKNIFKVFS